MSAWRLIGIDCAVNPKDMGIAEALVCRQRVSVKRITVGAADPVQYITSVAGGGGATLLALDSPLGWPSGLGSTLFQHQAGQLIDECSNQLFRRETDRFVRNLVGKQPLEVGADRIARTAVASLKLINALSERLGNELPLLWNPREIGKYGCIEVYPAATLESLGMSSRGYKGRKQAHEDARGMLVKGLSEYLDFSETAAAMAQATDHALDAAICCLAAADFVRGYSLSPRDESRARKEGWIWVRSPIVGNET